MPTLTPAAVEHILASAPTGPGSGQALRLAARDDGDGDRKYGMGFDDPHIDDVQLVFGGLRVVIAPAHQPFLLDTELDYVELEPGSFHFIFRERTPAEAAPRSCCSTRSGCTGCGA